jgi:hypothetical protein
MCVFNLVHEIQAVQVTNATVLPHEVELRNQAFRTIVKEKILRFLFYVYDDPCGKL